VRALDRKLIRDAWHLKGQVAAIGLVVACGVATVVTTRTSHRALVASRDAYYARYRFAHVFARLRRAPESLASRIAAISGVREALTRVVVEVTIDVPGLAEPATGRLVAIPDQSTAPLNGVHIRRGRYPSSERRGEVLVSEAFAEANALEPGSALGAVINGRWERLEIVGVALSPEYVYETHSASIFPDPKRFGVLWMRHDVLGHAFDMDGAFNDVALLLAADAVEADVVVELDRLLERYGGLGAYGRAEHVSDRFLSDEIAQDRVTGIIVPTVFLGVAAFLLNVVLSRLVNTQRDQIAVLKAFGYGDGSIGVHYLLLALVALAGGAVLGLLLGAWWGTKLSEIYARYYRFPVLGGGVDWGGVALGVAVTAVAAAIGAIGAVRHAVALPPAEAMRPEAPAQYRPGILERLGLDHAFPPAVRIIARNLERHPFRAGLSITGIALATAILVIGRYFLDAIEHIARVQFEEVQRENLTIVFNESKPGRIRYEMARLPGVLKVEPYRSVAARVSAGHRTRRVAILGLDADAELHQLVDRDLRSRRLPEAGIVLTTKLGEILEVRPGDTVRIEVLEGGRPRHSAMVAALVDEPIGLGAYIDRAALSRILREEGSLSGAWLRVDPTHARALHSLLKRTPAVAGVASRDATLASFRATLAQSIGIITTVILVFAGAIAVATVYNAARIALSERGRELASLRVLGFTRGEITAMLLGEQAALTAAAIPTGFAVGYAFAALVSRAYQWELFRMPLVVSGRTYLYAAAVILIAGAMSATVVRRRLDRMDLVAVLKTRE